ncbi:glycosyltransferase [Roseomonas sp. BN140053]|uniref:glycosyltransferase n=1 Tax=Roseomonas sp. BN140053 TaxID=3391898 RepID=UPI0039E88B17
MRLLIDMQGAQGVSRLRGIGRYSRELALALARDPRGYAVHLLVNAGLGDGGAELRDAFAGLLPPGAIHPWWGPGGMAEVTAPSPARRAAAEILRAEAINRLAPDLLLNTSLFEGSSDNAVTRWPADRPRPASAAVCYDLIPLIQRGSYLDGPWAGAQGLKDWYFRCLHELAASDLLLAISEASRRDAIDHLALSPDAVVNIRAGNSPAFRPQRIAPAEAAALLARHGLRDGFILFVGAGDPRKNEAGLLRAYGLLPPGLRAAHQLVVVGAADPDSFAAARREAGLRPEEVRQIRFVPEADLPALYALCALSVLPSFYEGFGLPALEAMACGAPTLGSRAGSLPEVIGLDEALFDPADPADMARVITRALRDPAFRQTLLAHAPAQAAPFTWTNTAARAWTALEAAARRDAPPPDPHRRLPRLALVAPLPPEPTGIADYTRELAPALSRHYDVTLVSSTGRTEDERLRGCFPALDADRFRQGAHRFDRVLFQLGNSEMHEFQYAGLLAEQPGVATLHDSFLSGHALWRAYRSGHPARFAATLHASHGWPAVLHWAREGEIAAARAWPCTLPVLRDTIGLIQHSEDAVRWTARFFDPATAGRPAIIPHLRQLPPPGDRAAARRRLDLPPGARVIASFGILARAKLPERLVAAWQQLPAGESPTILAFVGERVEELALPPAGETLRFTGRVSPATYADWMAAADVAVQLRAQSRGETSGALFDGMAAGLPVVNNSHGAMAELPADCLRAIPEGFTDAELAATLLALLDDPAAARALGARARAWVREHLSPASLAARYRDAIEAAYADPEAFHRLGDPFRGAALPPGDAADWAAVAHSAVASCPPRRPPFLFLDVTAGWADAAAARRLLAEHPTGLRVDTVRLRPASPEGAAAPEAAEYRTAPEAAAVLLELTVPEITPQRLAAAPGDVLLLPGVPERDDPRWPALRQLRWRGCALARRDGTGRAVPLDGEAALPAWLDGLAGGAP